MNLKRGWASSEPIWNLAEMVGPRHKQLRNYPHCRVLCAGKRKRATDRLTVTVLLEQKQECWLVITFQGIKAEGAHMKETLPFTSAPRIPTALWPVTSPSFCRCCSLVPYKVFIPTDIVYFSWTSVVITRGLGWARTSILEYEWRQREMLRVGQSQCSV